MATWTNSSKNTSSWTNQTLAGGSSVLFGDLPLSYFNGYTLDDIPPGGYKAIKDYTFDEPLSLSTTNWTNGTRNSSTWSNATRN